MDSLERIWQQAQAGDRMGARRELAFLLHTQPENLQAWMLLAELLDEPAQQADCYRRVLRFAPDHGQAIDRLSAVEQSFGIASHADVVIPELFDDGADHLSDETAIAAWERTRLTNHVLHELIDGVDRRTLILQVCEMGEMLWPEAELFVAQVEQGHKDEVLKRQIPFLIAYTILGMGIVPIILYLVFVRMDSEMALEWLRSAYFPYIGVLVLLCWLVGLILLSLLRKKNEALKEL
jgi:hypothetical protein